MSFRSRLVLLAVLVVWALFLAACAADEESPASDETSQGTSTEVTGADPVAAQGDQAGDEKPVLMLGRSTMWGWFKHWGWDGTPESLPLSHNGYALTYQEIAEPDEIAESATAFMDEAPEGSTVFFKFCFVDFPGSDEPAVRLDKQKQWVAQVVDKAEERNLALIVGNALPKTRPENGNDPAIVSMQQDFNAWLDSYAAARGFHVFDFYGVLAAEDGSIEPAYASAPDDAHPNDDGYARLDPGLFGLLDEVAR